MFETVLSIELRCCLEVLSVVRCFTEDIRVFRKFFLDTRIVGFEFKVYKSIICIK